MYQDVAISDIAWLDEHPMTLLRATFILPASQLEQAVNDMKWCCMNFLGRCPTCEAEEVWLSGDFRL